MRGRTRNRRQGTLRAVMWPRHHGAVPVAVIDVGSNTVRVHVARGDEVILRERAMLRLGESIEQTGAIPEPKLAEAVA